MNATATDVSSEATQASTKAPKAAPVVDKVTMPDGRVVEFVGKRKMLKESFFTEAGLFDYTRFDFRNGNVVEIRIPSELKFGTVLAREQFIGHGIEQKYGDETAGTDDVDDMQLEVEDLDKRIQKGEWSMRREGTGMAGTSVLLKALVEYSQTTSAPKTSDQIKAFLTGKSQAEKLALRTSPQLKPIVDRLDAEKVSKAAKVDTDALFGDLATAGDAPAVEPAV